MKLDYLDGAVAKFNMRITAICWHPKFPCTYAVGSKHGDIVVGSVDRKFIYGIGNAGWPVRDIAKIKGVSYFAIYLFVYWNRVIDYW